MPTSWKNKTSKRNIFTAVLGFGCKNQQRKLKKMLAITYTLHAEKNIMLI